MNRPYIMALKRPAVAEPLPFRKKEMVIGTMGNTQGVSSIAKPQSMASSIRPQSEEPEDAGSASETVVSRAAAPESGAGRLSAPGSWSAGEAGAGASEAWACSFPSR